MSDEMAMEAAHRHRDPVAVAPWSGAQPDEAAMRWEAGLQDQEDGGFSALADWQEEFLVFAFSSSAPEDWRGVALRAHAVLRAVCPGVIATRTHHELLDIRQGAGMASGHYPLGDLVGDARGMEDRISAVLSYYFPDGREWLKNGTQNLYLLARLYQPGLVTRWNGELSYERLAMVFGEIPAEPQELDPAERVRWCPAEVTAEAWEEMKARARSRWSARAQKLIMQPMQRAGASMPALYGKSQKVREKYRQAARGNQNRKGGGV